MASNPQTESGTKPNFLFFFPDQHRADWLGTSVDLPLRTPNLDRLAANGIRFNNAFCPSPLCAPSRACLAAGKGYDRCRVRNNRSNYPLDQPTYYQSLRDVGYRVAGVGKFDLHKPEADWGLDGSRLLKEWGLTDGVDNEGKVDGIASYLRNGAPKGPYLNYLHERGLAALYMREKEIAACLGGAYTTNLPEDAYCDNWIAATGLKILEDIPKETPWHLAVNFTGPHSPMNVTARMRAAWQDVRLPPAHANDKDDPEFILRARQNYAAMIENIDRHLGHYLGVLEERGELERTVVVYSSDHGEMLGDHGRWGKKLWYQQSAAVPLIAAGPGIIRGRLSDALVNIYDLAATFIDYANAATLPEMDAISLRPLLEGKTDNHRDFIVSGLDQWRMVFEGRFKLVFGAGEEPLLYDLSSDPDEDNNIAAARPEEVGRLRALLESDCGGAYIPPPSPAARRQ